MVSNSVVTIIVLLFCVILIGIECIPAGSSNSSEEVYLANRCNSTPCGPNSHCTKIKGEAVCSCLPFFIGTPPTCRAECVSSSECALNRTCINQKCTDPCPATCGRNATCEVVKHIPACSCPPGQTGHPYIECTAMVLYPETPCEPSPCGPNSLCKEIQGSAACSCLTAYIGSPPNCRPECITSIECADHLACINIKCEDPCPGTCPQNAECKIVNHSPKCECLKGYDGDPYTQCQLIPQLPPK